jgi:hypothetical protein
MVASIDKLIDNKSNFAKAFISNSESIPDKQNTLNDTKRVSINPQDYYPSNPRIWTKDEIARLNHAAALDTRDLVIEKITDLVVDLLGACEEGSFKLIAVSSLLEKPLIQYSAAGSLEALVAIHSNHREIEYMILSHINN